MKKYFVTGNETLGFQASQFIHAKYSGKYFAKAKEALKDAEFVKANEVYQILGDGDGSDVTLIISEFSKAWSNSFCAKYPKAIIEAYKLN